jgi:hypothetical protein
VTARPAILAGKDLTRPIDAADVDAIRTHPAVVAATPRARLSGPASARGSFDGHEISFELGGFTDGIPATAVTDEPEVAARFVDLDPKAAAGATVPVIVSPALLELYNQRFAPARDLPRIDATMAGFLVGKRPLAFTITIGTSLGGAAGSAVLEVDATIVGVSKHAQPMGITVPIGHVMAWNRALGQSAPTYTSVDVRLRDAQKLETFDRWLGDKLELVAGPATVVRRPTS